MDIYKAIHDLIQERKHLDAVIASLEARSRTGGQTKSRRGRKSMSAEERAQVSRRMAAYWATRRAQSTPPQPAEEVEVSASGQMPPPELAKAAGMDAAL